MRKYIFGLCIFIVFMSCNNNSINVVDRVKQYINKNELPIKIGDETTVDNDINFTDKANFQLYIMDLLNTLSNNISEGNFTDKTIENYKELENIVTGFYNYCVKNNYELAIIFKNTGNVLIDYLEYYNYNQSYYNDFIIFNNNTTYDKLKELIDIMLKIETITRINLINYFLHDWNDKDTYIYQKILLIDGNIETIDMNIYVYDPSHKDSINGWLINNEIDLVFETILMSDCHKLIGEVIYLLKIKGFNIEGYENILEEINKNIVELQNIINDYNRNKQSYYTSPNKR